MSKTVRRFKPYQRGYLNVSDGHKLYYEFCGNKSGIPILFLHGGPGSGFVESHKKVFDFKKFNVIFFDQRGAGRSKPFASLKANTTAKLISDINKILDFAGIKNALIFGGSWGSTLALAYALKHPERVLALQLRGIFLGDSQSMKYYLNGGVSVFVPEVWDRFVQQVPEKFRKNVVQYYVHKMKSKNFKEREKACYEWARYEISLVKMKMTKKEIEESVKEYSYMSLAPLEAHFLTKNCFMPDNYIIKNAQKLSGIPVSIVHGRYDLVCQPRDAYRLHKEIRGSRLKFVFAGHSASEPEIEKAQRAELKRFAGLLKNKI
jgi:proline iminopeptidase